MEYPLGEKCSPGHLGKLRKGYAEYSTSGICSLTGNIGLTESELAMLRSESRCGSFLDLIFHIFFIVICSSVLLSGVPDIGFFTLCLPHPHLEGLVDG